MTSENKTCAVCGKPVKGRTDKRFCDSYCRSTFNNQQNGSGNRYIRSINHTLYRNRRILKELLPATAEAVKAPVQDLYTKGFLFNYFTHTHTSKKGITYYFCYDHGYLPLEGDRMLIVRKNHTG